MHGDELGVAELGGAEAAQDVVDEDAQILVLRLGAVGLEPGRGVGVGGDDADEGVAQGREQAATALKHRGIACVIAASFGETYRRNAFNNGFLCIECPALVDHLAATLGEGSPTIPGPGVTIEFTTSTIGCDDRAFPFAPLSTVAQELVVAGGAEAIAGSSLARVSRG